MYLLLLGHGNRNNTLVWERRKHGTLISGITLNDKNKIFPKFLNHLLEQIKANISKQDIIYLSLFRRMA
jgi:hypothetical protein